MNFRFGVCLLLLVSLLFGAQRFSAQLKAQTRQLEQLPAVNTWPGKAKRWALVIGVDQYTDPQISPLKGAANDARSLADALTRYAGFPADQVVLLASDQPVERQPTRLNILRRLSNLASLVPKDGLLLISFAGHGIERGGQAYLIPSDSQISDDITLLEESAVSINRVKERIRLTGVGQVVILLDACRNDPGGRADAPNPMSEAFVRGFNFDVRNREITAFVTLYATAVGQRAFEYTEKKQGYFTWAVVEALKGGAANEKGEVTLANLMKFVQENVPKRVAIDLGVSKQQRPFYQMEGYKAEELIIAVGGSSTPTAAPVSSGVDSAAIELSYWDSIKNSTNVDDFKSYLEKYPGGQFSTLAHNRIRGIETTNSSVSKASEATELAFWDSIKNSSNVDDFRAYLKKYPQGEFVELANNRIVPLEAAKREKEKTDEANRVEAERARLTRSFVGMFGAKMSMNKGFTWNVTLTITPDQISYTCGDNTNREQGHLCQMGTTRIFDCKELSKAITDDNTIREIAIGQFKYRFYAQSPADASAAFASIRNVCKKP